jgi:hypothetical protein
MTTLLAYHGDPKIKERYVARVAAHREADELIHGTGWEDGKGCAIGCLFEEYDHSLAPTQIGVPEVLAHLADEIFEGLKNGDAQTWATEWVEAIPVGADLSLVWPRFAEWMLVDPTDGVIRFAEKDEAVAKAIREVASLHSALIRGEVVGADRWAAARAAAWAARAAAWAAWDAAWAARAAAGAAWDAAWAAGDAAGDAWAAARAAGAAAGDAGDAAWKRMAAKLIALLKAAPVGRGEGAGEAAARD